MITRAQAGEVRLIERWTIFPFSLPFPSFINLSDTHKLHSIIFTYEKHQAPSSRYFNTIRVCR